MIDIDISLIGQDILSFIGITDTYRYSVVYDEETGTVVKSSNPKLNIIKQDFLYLMKKYLSHMEKRVYDKEALSLALVVEVLEHHNFKYNLNELLSSFDISLDRFDIHSYRVREFAKKYYWKDGVDYWKENLSRNVKIEKKR